MPENYEGFQITRDINAGAYVAAFLGVALLVVFLLRRHWMIGHMGQGNFGILLAVIAAGTLFCLGLSIRSYFHGMPQVLITATPQDLHCRPWPETQRLPWSEIENLTVDATRTVEKGGSILSGYRIRITLKPGAAAAIALGRRELTCELPRFGVDAKEVAHLRSYWQHYGAGPPA